MRLILIRVVLLQSDDIATFGKHLLNKQGYKFSINQVNCSLPSSLPVCHKVQNYQRKCQGAMEVGIFGAKTKTPEALTYPQLCI